MERVRIHASPIRNDGEPGFQIRNLGHPLFWAVTCEPPTDALGACRSDRDVLNPKVDQIAVSLICLESI